MPTDNRRRFVPEAIRLFLAQDYPNKELVVLDDGEDIVADLIPKTPEIRYLRLDRRQSLGAKRNLACAAARGEIIAHWDDDDWYAPWRLSRQVAKIVRGGTELCGLARMLFFDPLAASARGNMSIRRAPHRGSMELRSATANPSGSRARSSTTRAAKIICLLPIWLWCGYGRCLNPGCS